VKLTRGLLDGLIEYRKMVQDRVVAAEASGQPPDGGHQLGKAKRALERAGIDVPSFDVDLRLPDKPTSEIIEVIKILALCPYKGASAAPSQAALPLVMSPRRSHA
jgi:hypothetical protein